MPYSKKIPKTMSTQHPDNATMPSFASDPITLKGEDEILEADYAFSKFHCTEQMWDYEGKDTDVDVVLKLLTHNKPFFEENQLGKNVFLTLRIPNPKVEKSLQKKVEEALHSIVVSHDLATTFYNKKISPIFEVILPLTTSSDELMWVYNYYKKFVTGKENETLFKNTTVKNWIGESNPKTIELIPLIEDMKSLINIDTIIKDYIKDRKKEKAPISHLRIFLARSDPALNYGFISATLLTKIALSKLQKLSDKINIPFYPIIGVGSVPFRGNFSPHNVDRVINEYPGIHTFTIQSSFKYDHPTQTINPQIKKLENRITEKSPTFDEAIYNKLIKKYTAQYQEDLEKITDLVSVIAPLIPNRRSRRIHVGLFGYSREISNAKQKNRIILPRAITFCASLYSIGIPPEILGLTSLNNDDIELIEAIYPSFKKDLADSLQYANANIIQEILGTASNNIASKYTKTIDEEHTGLTTLIFKRVKYNLYDYKTKELIEWASKIRKFLG